VRVGKIYFQDAPETSVKLSVRHSNRTLPEYKTEETLSVGPTWPVSMIFLVGYLSTLSVSGYVSSGRRIGLLIGHALV
jgi:hypothetical protein